MRQEIKWQVGVIESTTHSCLQHAAQEKDLLLVTCIDCLNEQKRVRQQKFDPSINDFKLFLAKSNNLGLWFKINFRNGRKIGRSSGRAFPMIGIKWKLKFQRNLRI